MPAKMRAVERRGDAENECKPSRAMDRAAVPRAVLDEIGNRITVRTTQFKKSSRGRKQTCVNENNLKAVTLICTPQKEDRGGKRLPPGVIDIDARSADNVFLVTAYADDVYSYLRRLEERHTIKKYYLEGSGLTGPVRAGIVDWLVDVQLQYGLSQETLHHGVALMDDFLQKTPDAPGERIQLVAITCTALASKFGETYSPDLREFALLCEDVYTMEEAVATEARVLRTLDWNLSRALLIEFVRRYNTAAESDALQHALCKYAVDLALVRYSLCHLRYSHVAAAAVFIAKCLSSGEVSTFFWSPTVAHYSGYGLFDFAYVVPRLAKTVLKAKFNKHLSVRRKYSSRELLEVSLLPIVHHSSPVLRDLCSFELSRYST